MAAHIKNEESKYVRQREQALRDLEEIAPEIVRRFRFAEAALEALRTPQDQRYMKVRGHVNAAIAVLEDENRWMSRYEIADKLLAGGYPMDPVTGRRLIVFSIDKATQHAGRIVRQGELVGKSEWLTNPPSQKKS